jgi:hypothetical protein
MTRTTQPVTSVENNGIRSAMIRNALCHNKYLSKEFLNFKTNEVLLCFCHPSDRIAFATKLGLKNVSKFADPEGF